MFGGDQLRDSIAAEASTSSSSSSPSPRVTKPHPSPSQATARRPWPSPLPLSTWQSTPSICCSCSTTAPGTADDSIAALSCGPWTRTTSCPRSEERRVGKEGRDRWPEEQDREKGAVTISQARLAH